MASFFIAEGDLVIERAIAHGFTLESVLLSAKRTRPLPDVVGDTTVFVAADNVLEAITGRPALRDPLACFRRPEPTDVASLLESARTVAVLENVNNPNNMGVIMRNAVGLGIDAVLLDPACIDPLYRRAIRSAMGQVFALPHARLHPFPDGLQALHDAGFETLALTPSGDIDLREFTRPDKVAVLLGAEGDGLKPQTMAAATHRARITMANNVDSLNVANAAAIAFHHVGTT